MTVDAIPLKVARAEAKATAEAPPEPPARDEPWPPLVTLDAPKLPRLSAKSLPAWAGAFTAALAAETETPPELAAGLVLATVATAGALHYSVRVGPDYFEPVNLWVAVALPPGNRKSAVQKKAARPLLDWERDRAETMGDEIRRAESEVATLTARAKEFRAKAARAAEDAEARDLAHRAAEIEATMPEVPRAPMLWTSDVTPERLGVLLADHRERMAWLSSEGGVFDLLAGRYSGGIPNLDLVLKAHSGDAERVSRNGRPDVFLRHPLLTVGLSPQPDVLRGLASRPGFRGRGLLGRFLFLLPPSPLGFRSLASAPMPEGIATAYAAGVRAILDTPPDFGPDDAPRPRVLRLSPPAYQEWFAFARHIETTMRPGGEFEGATDWAGKCPGAAARLAGVLHLIQHAHAEPWAVEVSAETMAGALDLMAVVAKHSRHALDLMGADDAIAAARRFLDWINRNRLPEFTLRDAFEGLKGMFPRVAALREVADVLEERGYIRVDEVPPRGRGRPPSPRVIVRPDVVEGWR